MHDAQESEQDPIHNADNPERHAEEARGKPMFETLDGMIEVGFSYEVWENVMR